MVVFVSYYVGVELFCAGFLLDVSYYLVAQIEPCFLRIFSHFSGTGELNFLMKKSYEGAHYYYYYYYYYIHIYIYTLL